MSFDVDLLREVEAYIVLLLRQKRMFDVFGSELNGNERNLSIQTAAPQLKAVSTR